MILVVDDDPRVLKTFARNLKVIGYGVMTATDGDEALQVYRQERPDVVLVDVRMPRTDGFGVLAAIREQNAEAEVILVTGHGDMGVAIEALRAGASDFIPKPVEATTLETALRRADERLRLKRKLRAAQAELKQYAADLEARNQELHEAQARLIRESNLALLGNLAFALMHEINNPLAAIKLAADSVRLNPDVDKSIRHTMEAIHESTDEISAVMARVYNVPKLKSTQMASIEVNQVVRSALATVQRQGFLEESRLEIDLTPDLPPVRGHWDHLHTVFANIILNAAEALESNSDPPRGLTMRTSLVHPSNGREPCVRIEFVDDGPGIPQDALERVFDPDYTTKIKQGWVHGLGLGLFVAQGIVEIHGGDLRVANRENGAGVVVTIELPAEITPSPST
jgi:C4-dicarboxylate-specific signal transduction histidine kinase